MDAPTLMALLGAADGGVKFSEIAPLLGTLLGGGLIGWIVQWRKSGAEKDSIVATASKSAIEVFEASIKQLKADLTDSESQIRTVSNDLSESRAKAYALEQDLGRSQANVSILETRITELSLRLEEMSESLQKVQNASTALIFERDNFRNERNHYQGRVAILEAKLADLA